jgi:DNA invertase Pin-like site-specific DNA recombinase
LQWSHLCIDDETLRLKIEKARAKGKAIGRPVVDKVDAELVAQLRNEGKSWPEIAEAR